MNEVSFERWQSACKSSGFQGRLQDYRRVVRGWSSNDAIDSGSWQEQLREYYRAEVLDTLPSLSRATMSRLVVVERFDASLAQALVGRQALDLIEQLHHVDGLLLRHRGTQEFYFSQMLRRFLESRLVWLDENERAELHGRAAQWFLDRGRLQEALRHAVEAGARDLALTLLERIGYANVVIHRGVLAAHRLLISIDADTLAWPPGVLLSLSLIQAHQGDVKGAVVSLTEARQRLAANHGAPDCSADAELVLAEGFVAGFLDETGSTDNRPALEQYLNRTPHSDHESRAQAYMVDGTVRCVYHHWRYGTDGRCAGMPSKDPIPDAARLFKFPVKEKYDIVWAYNGIRASL
jgi:LuxR family transcriptional regulator, maltose regulon positive regulatory protein